MTTLKKLSAAFAAGVIFQLIFFYFNDADRAGLLTFCVVLFPIAVVICAKWESKFLLNAMAVVLMLFGIFVGTCVAIILYSPDKANIFPIAAAIWTITASVPIILGGIFGPLVMKFYEYTV